MTSQLNVDTIVDKAGSGGTNVKIGNTSTYVGEGGSGTQNTVQGLVKSWVFSGEDASLTNAFNTASGTDNSTGNYSFTYTSNLSNSDPSAAASVTDNSDRTATVYSSTTTGYTTEVFNQAGNEVDSRNRTIICGDLA
jgi:hypothetical protein